MSDLKTILECNLSVHPIKEDFDYKNNNIKIIQELITWADAE